MPFLASARETFRPRDFPPAEVVVSTDGFWPFAPYVTDACSRDGLCGSVVALYVVAMIDEWHAVVDFRVAAVIRDNQIGWCLTYLCKGIFIDVAASSRLHQRARAGTDERTNHRTPAESGGSHSC